MELEQNIIEEGKKRGITIIKVDISAQKNPVLFYMTIRNNYTEGWIDESQVRKLIDDFAPLERPHEISIYFDRDSDFFKIGDEVEIDDLMTKDGVGEQGWVKGTVVETPKQNDRFVEIVFDKDVYWEQEGKTIKLEAGKSMTIGHLNWHIRKI